jgi:hypothetical protein
MDNNNFSSKKHLPAKHQMWVIKIPGNLWQSVEVMEDQHNLSLIQIPESLCKKEE